MTDTTVTIPDIAVMCVVGDKAKPIHEQAPAAFRELEAKLSTLKGRKFYGAFFGGEYRACVAIDPRQDLNALPLPEWTLPGGRYVRRKLAQYQSRIPQIGAIFTELRARPDADPSRPCIEYYRSGDEVLLMAPIRSAGEASGGWNDHEQLSALNDDFIRSVQEGDVARFEEILADDFLNSSPDASISDKKQFLAAIGRPVTIKGLAADDVRVRIFGDFAIIHGRTSYTTAEGEKRNGRYTDIYARRGGHWLAVAAHVTR
jgi:ketosteroid isomerase-like protein